MTEWFSLIASARQRLGLSQAELAERAYVSLPTVKAYEQGKRHPSRPYIVAMLDALKIEREERGAILQAAGYAHDWEKLGPVAGDLDYDLDGAQEAIDKTPWPAFVVNENFEVVAANALVLKLWDVDLAREFTDVADRNMLVLASNPRFASHVLNWDESVGTFVGMFKAHHRGAEALDDPSPNFRATLERFLAGDPQYIGRFLKLWQEVPPKKNEQRWTYPMHWDAGGAGAIRFHCVVSNASFMRSWAFNDWIPRDSASWAVLEGVLGEGAS
jgi:transcriptional regulator with XRE-family HTH domain